MASMVFSEPPASRLSISLEGAPASASNFPSPSSSFLPPPTPGAHEFAVKTPAGRKQSASKPDKEASKRASGAEAENGSAVEVSTAGSAYATVNGTPNGIAKNGVLKTVTSVPVPTSPLPTTPSTPTPGSVLVHRSSMQNGIVNGRVTSSALSNHLEPPRSPALYTYTSTSASVTPTISQVQLPAEYDETLELRVDTNVSSLSGLSGPPSRPLSTSLDSSLFSNRPAPPSPALSATTRRLSRALSNSSRGGGSLSRPTSMGISVSRANSLRNKDGGGGMGSPREMGAFALPSPIALDGNGSPIGFGASVAGLVGTPTTATMKRLSTLSTNSVASIEEHPEDDDAPRSAILIPRTSILESPASVVSPTQAMVVDVMDEGHATKRPPKHYIKIRDFGFPAGDDRHIGMGDEVPKANRVERVNRKLAMAPSVRARRRESEMSWGSGGGSSASENEGDEEEDWADASWGWGGQRASYGGFGYGAEASSSSTTTTNGGGASNPDFDRNFMEHDHGFEDAGEGEEEVEGEEEQLYPGLYRAMYAFEPEGTAEMKLEEDQIVRVVGRGGGVGWAVVVVPDGDEAVVVNGDVGVLVADGPQGSKSVRHALVPESYLEPYMLDGWGAEDGAPTA